MSGAMSARPVVLAKFSCVLSCCKALQVMGWWPVAGAASVRPESGLERPPCLNSSLMLFSAALVVLPRSGGVQLWPERPVTRSTAVEKRIIGG
jgi:hypothetical protein